MHEHPIRPAREGAASQSRSASPTRRRVLIVDDQDASRTLCAGYCDLFDHIAETAGSREEAISALSRRHFDVVLINVHMEEDAFGALQAVRARAPGAGRTPVIGLAAAHRADEAQRWMAAGLAGVLAKPITAARLFAAIRSALSPDPGGGRALKAAH